MTGKIEKKKYLGASSKTVNFFLMFGCSLNKILQTSEDKTYLKVARTFVFYRLRKPEEAK